MTPEEWAREIVAKCDHLGYECVGDAACPACIAAAVGDLLAALEAFLDINSGAYDLTTGVRESTVPFAIEVRGRVADFRAAYEAGRAALRRTGGAAQ